MVGTVSGWLQMWERPFVIEATELVEQGGRYVVDVRWHGRSKAGGAAVESRNTHLWTFRDGLAVRFEVHSDRERALAALGEEQPTGRGDAGH